MPRITKLEKLASFMKMNKQKRERKAVIEGYANAEEYLTYLRKGLPSSKRKTTVTKVDKKVVKSKEEAPESKETELTDMVIAFDTTGSMSSYIGDVKKHVASLIPELLDANPNLKISVVAFGDYCDMKNSREFGKAYQFLDLTANETDLINFVTNAKNTRGGDGDEFYELVIKKITEETSWRKDSKKSVLFIADAEPHPLGYSLTPFVTNSQIDWKEEAKKAAAAGIAFDTLKIHKHIKWYEQLSKITGGLALDFQSSNKTSQLVKAATLARGGKVTKDLFEKELATTMASGDKELTAVYSMYKTTL